MKRYTIEEIQKFLIWVEKEYPQIRLQNAIFMVTEDKLNEANEYTLDTHVENENKFENDLPDTYLNLGPKPQSQTDAEWANKIMSEGADPSNDSIY